MKLKLSAVLFILTFASVTANAAVVVNYDPGTTNVVDGITTFDTSGADMDGMGVTVSFGDGTSDILFWADTGVNSGGVFGADWSLSFSGVTTFSSGWVLSYAGDSYIDTVSIDAGLGNTVFDTTNPSTPDSANGWPFSVSSGGDGVDIVASYSDQVAVSPNAPVGDLYRNLSLDFSAVGSSVGGFTGIMTFRADTDNATSRVVAVSEPSSALLLVLALFGLAFSRLRR